MKNEILLRGVVKDDLTIFYEHQIDSDAVEMAANLPRDQEAFQLHWTGLSVAKHNRGSLRVLEKCGFRIVGEDKEFSNIGGKVVEGIVLELGI